MLIAATNPCPCGYAGEGERCRCNDTDLARHRRRLSGPLLDRIDLLACLEHAGTHDPDGPPLMSSAAAGERVMRARERQVARLKGDGVTVNAYMDARMLQRHVSVEGKGDQMLQSAREQG